MNKEEIDNEKYNNNMDPDKNMENPEETMDKTEEVAENTTVSNEKTAEEKYAEQSSSRLAAAR